MAFHAFHTLSFPWAALWDAPLKGNSPPRSNLSSGASNSSAASDTTQKPRPQNGKEFVTLNIATQESWKNDKGEYETRTEWHRVYAWSNLSKFARTLQKGQLITLEGILRYREVTEDVEGQRFQTPHR